ncbi:hypothetical protein [Alteromonas portus]|uniref:hypothetical protein n=1 Tax=Alteromonas portus TaxID=2565549 RepID=UPI003BF82C71
MANNDDKSQSKNKPFFEVQKVENEDGLGDIFFGVDDETTKFPDYVVDFKDEIEYFISVIQLLYGDTKSESLYKKYYERLFTIADLAFNSPQEKVKLAERSLHKLKSELTTSVGQRIRTKLLMDYLKLAIWPSIIAIIIVLLGDSVLTCVLAFLGKGTENIYISSLGLISIAAMAGGWISTATETRNLAFVDIVSVINNQRGILVRLIFINLFSIFAAILMIAGFLKINIGGLDSLQIVDSPTVALAFGFALGFLDKVFVDRVEAKLSKTEAK